MIERSNTNQSELLLTNGGREDNHKKRPSSSLNDRKRST